MALHPDFPHSPHAILDPDLRWFPADEVLRDTTFVESIQAEGVELERKAMGEGTGPKTPLVVEVDKENRLKALDALDIEIPVLT